MLSGFEVRASCRDIGRSAVRRDPYGGLKSFFILLARIRAYQFSLKNWLRGILVPQLIKVCAVSHVILNLLTLK